MLRTILWFSILFFVNITFAQMQIVGSPEKLTTERVGKRDPQGRFCAAIQVISELDGFKYDSYNGVVEVDDQPGMDMVYLQPDERVLQIRHTGYAELKIILSEVGVQLKPQEVWKIRIKGEPASGDVLPITFFVQPQDAVISVDGKPAQHGQAIKLSKGSHRLHIEKQGFKTLDEAITVTENNVVFNRALPEVEPQAVQIKSTPTEAQIFLDNMDKGLTDKGLYLYPASYQLKLLKAGYVEANETITVREGVSNIFSYTLIKNSATLTLSVEPRDAQVLINKENYSGRSSVELAPGQYKIEISKSGFNEQSETITIVRGETVRKTYTLTAKTGKLQFNVQPLEAKVTLKRGGNAVETWQGMKILNNLPVGDYEVECVAAGYKTETQRLSIAENKTAELDIKMNKGGGYTPPGVTTSDNMVFVEGGTFRMGSNDGESDEKPVHTVTVSSFYISKYEVTQKEWVAVMGNNPSNWKGDNLPVENVSWNDVQEYIRKLNAKTGANYRMPTEAEWEYAARGGNRSRGYKYSGSNNADAVAWYDGNSGSKTHAVGQKKPNELGLFDMSGNVWEWCQDWYSDDYYSSSPSNNPQGSASGSARVLRGGSWFILARGVRVADRYRAVPDRRGDNLGFRLVRTY